MYNDLGKSWLESMTAYILLEYHWQLSQKIEIIADERVKSQF